VCQVPHSAIRGDDIEDVVLLETFPQPQDLGPIGLSRRGSALACLTGMTVKCHQPHRGSRRGFKARALPCDRARSRPRAGPYTGITAMTWEDIFSTSYLSVADLYLAAADGRLLSGLSYRDSAIGTQRGSGRPRGRKDTGIAVGSAHETLPGTDTWMQAPGGEPGSGQVTAAILTGMPSCAIKPCA